MGRRKRSDRQQEKPAVATLERPEAEARVLTTGAKAILFALCPICGRSIPEQRVTARGTYGALEKKPYFETIDWDADKPFGVRLATSGKGSFKNWDYIDKDEVPELFEALKKRLLEAIKEWLHKGWLSEEEVAGLMKSLHSE